MKTACTLHSIQTTKATSNPISTVLAPFRLIKSHLLAMWRGEEASAAPEATKDAESHGATKVIKDTKTSKASEAPDHPEHTEKSACLEAVENRKDKSEDKDSLKDDDCFWDEDENPFKDDPKYQALKNFMNHIILAKDDDEQSHQDHSDYYRINLAVDFLDAINQNKYFSVPVDVFCIAANICILRHDINLDPSLLTTLCRRRLRNALRFIYAKNNNQYIEVSTPELILSRFIRVIYIIMCNNVTNSKPISIETVR